MARWEQAAIKKDSSAQPRWASAKVKREPDAVDRLERSSDWVTAEARDRLKKGPAPAPSKGVNKGAYWETPSQPTGREGLNYFQQPVAPPPKPEEVEFSQYVKLPDAAREAREYQAAGGRSGELLAEGMRDVMEGGRSKEKGGSVGQVLGAIPKLAAGGFRAGHDYYTDPTKSADDKGSGTIRALLDLSGVGGGIRADDFANGRTVWQDMGGEPLPDDYNPTIDRTGQVLGAMFAGGRGQIGKAGGVRGFGNGLTREAADAGLDALTNASGGVSDIGAIAAKPFVQSGTDLVNGLRQAPRQAAPQPPAIAPTASGGPPAAQATSPSPPPGNLTRIATPITSEYDALHGKVKSAIRRFMERSNVPRDRIPGMLAQIDSEIDSLTPEQATMVGIQLVRRYGSEFPDLAENLGAVGHKLGIDTPTGRNDFSRRTVDEGVREVMSSERPYIEGVANQRFGEGVLPAREAIDQDLANTSRAYQRILDPDKPYGRVRAPSARAQIDQARTKLKDHLVQPEVMDNVPNWVRDKVLLEVSKDMRDRGFTPAQKTIIGSDPGLAPLLTPDRELNYTPQLWRTLVDLYPTQIAHAVQSAYGRAIREAGSSPDPEVRTWIKKLQRRRGRSPVRANAAKMDDRGFGLLKLLEDAVPEYKKTRVEWGTTTGAEDAITIPQRFFAAANDEMALGQVIDELEDLTPRQFDAAKNQITSLVRSEMGKKVSSTKLSELDAAERGTPPPNLTRISNDNFLNGLEKAFGDDGTALANAVREARSKTDFLTGIHPKYNSRTATNTEDVKNAGRLFEHPHATDKNIVDQATQVMGSVGLGAALIPGAQGVSGTLLTLAGAKALWNAYKSGRKLSDWERTQFARFLFAARRKGEPGFMTPEASGRPPSGGPPRLPVIEGTAKEVSTPSPPDKAGLFSSGSGKALPMDEGARLAPGKVDAPLPGSLARGNEFAIGKRGDNNMRTLERNPTASTLNRLAREASRVNPNGMAQKPPPHVTFRWIKDVGGNTYIGDANTNLHDTMIAGLRKIGVKMPEGPGDAWRRVNAETDPGMNAGGLLRYDTATGKWEIQSSDFGWKPFDPSEEGSSRLLAGAPKEEIFAGGIGASAGANFDYNGDGEISAEERIAGAAGGFALGAGIMSKLKGRGAQTGASQMTFGGVNAKTADKKLLGIAEQMERAGAGKEQIWRETGWFKGVDGKWRFEIDDRQAKLKTPDAPPGKEKVYQDAKDLYGFPPPYDGPLSGVLRDPDARGAYPDLANVRAVVDFNPSMQRYGEHALQDDKFGKEAMGAQGRTKGQQRSVLLHERQHAVQDREDFARGGSPEAFESERLGDFSRELNKADLALEAAESQAPQATFNVWDRTRNAVREANFVYATKAQKAAGEKAISEFLKLPGGPDIWEAWRAVQTANERVPSAFDRYRALAGEVEARNVSKRMNLTPDQRRAQPPWTTEDVPQDQQIVRYGSGRQESRSKSDPPGSSGVKPKPPEGKNGLSEPLPFETKVRPERGNGLRNKPPISNAEEAARAEVKSARSAYTRADNKYVMKADRARYVQPMLERMAAAEAKLAKVQKTEAAFKTVKGRAKDVGGAVARVAKGEAKNWQDYGFAGGVVGAPLAAVVGVNALTDKPPSNVISPGDPRYFWSTVTKDKAKMTGVQQSLDAWGDWDDEVPMTGHFGQTTKDAIAAWRVRRGKDPRGVMTRKDVQELLAGPRGFQDNKGVWRYGDTKEAPAL